MLIPLTAEQQQWVDSTLNRMTLPQCVGQLLCAFSPRFTTADWLDLLNKVPIGALTVRTTSSVDLREQMHALQDRSAVPLLATADLEHGATALTDGTEFPWMMGAGAADDAELMTIMGQATAAEARYAGLHWTFSPVVDLNYSLNNPITNVRALSDQPERVSRLATAFVRSLQADGRLAATAKHFPGDGLDDRDQHLATTVNNLPFEQWQATYGRVWRAVIEAGVMCIMPGHISLPDYQGFGDRPEDAPPATLSPKLLNELLRGALGFEGLLISDASGMIGLTTRISSEERVVQCIKSGMDVYLFPDTLKDFDRLVQAVGQGRLSEERVRQAARRVLELKARLNLHRDPFGPKPSAADKSSYQQAAQRMADKSITVLRSDGRPPIGLRHGSRVLTVTIGHLSPFSKFRSQPDLDAFDDELRQRGFQVEHLLNPEDDLLLAKAAEHDAVFINLLTLPYMVLGTIRNLVGHLGHWRWRSLFVDHPQVLFTSFGNPYVLHEMPHLPNLLAAYGDSDVSQRAAVKVWLGEIEDQGNCPVRLPKITVQPHADAATQAPASPTFHDTLTSPEVLTDRRVIFRIYAPKASEVCIDGDWILQGRGTGGPLQKDDQGIWSITVGPLLPDFYMYTLTVDGVPTIDPQNRMIKQGIATLKNVFLVPGEEAVFEDTRSVPHGDVRSVWYDSTTLGCPRRMHVYTPPGYDGSDQAYPVLYLIHGGGDDDMTWTTIGRAGFILDNLLAAGKVKPMIVVLPNGSMSQSVFSLRLTGADRNSPAAIKARIDTISRMHDLFVQDLLTTIIPHVEKRYRVLTTREKQAIAGLSMGGAETLRVAPSNLDKFAYIGVFSMGLQVGAHAGVNPDFEERNAGFFADPDRTNELLKLFWIAAGEDDQIITDGARRLSETLKRRGIEHTFNETGGGHTWINWRQYLYEFAQLLFRD